MLHTRFADGTETFSNRTAPTVMQRVSARRVPLWGQASRLPDSPLRCSRHLYGRPSAKPGLFVRFDLEAVHQLVEAAEKIDHCHKLEHGGIVQT